MTRDTRRNIFSMAALSAVFSAAVRGQTKVVPVQLSVSVPVMSKLQFSKSADGRVCTLNSGEATYVQVYWNGLIQEEGPDYSRTGNVITFVGGPGRDEAFASPQSIIQIHGYV